jgi:4-hydroxy-3-polyprenylbenzoate decarboxylase
MSLTALPPATVTLAFTGASGLPYGIRLLEQLLAAGCRVWLLYSPAAQVVAQQEMQLSLPSQAKALQALWREQYGCGERLSVFGREEWFAPPASGSNPADAMVICPCSMGALAAIAHGMSDNLIERAADVSIKEKRPLILVPRETPLSVIHLENMLTLARLGVTILPPAPGFYTHPGTVDDMVDFVVARILDQLRIPHTLMARWGELRT